MTCKSVRRFCSLLAVMALAAACLEGCNWDALQDFFTPGPAATVREFVNDVDGGRITDAVKLVNVPSGMERKVTKGLTLTATAQGRLGRRVTSVEIVKEDVRGELAHVEFIVHRGGKIGEGEREGGEEGAGEEEQKQEVDLEKIDGRWKLNLLGALASGLN